MKEKRSKGETLHISVLEFTVLIVNTLKAAQMKDEVGYLDSEVSYRELLRRLQSELVELTVEEAESLLAHCNMLDELDEFWNYKNQPFIEFVNSMINYKVRDKYFNEVYNLIKERPKIGRPRSDEAYLITKGRNKKDD